MLDDNKYSQFPALFTCFFELNYLAKVSHGKKIFSNWIFFVFVVFETSPIVVASTFEFFSGVFVAAEK